MSGADNEKKLKKLLRCYFPGMRVVTEEVMQAARVGQWKAEKSDFDPAKGSWSNWLGYFIRYEVRKQIKEERAFLRGVGKAERPTVDYLDAPLSVDDDSNTLHDTMISPGESPEEMLSRLEFDAHVRETVASLPYPDRHVVEHWLDGKTLAEIGEAMGLTRQRVGQVFTRAKRTLSKRL